MRILAIDPGLEKSAYVVLDDGVPNGWGDLDNPGMLFSLRRKEHSFDADAVVIECIRSFLVNAGQDLFITAEWAGRFHEAAYPTPAHFLPRTEIKRHLLGKVTGNDSNIRGALIDRFGLGREKAIGKKAAPGPCYGIVKHGWSALAVAVTFYDQQTAREGP